MKSFKDRMTNPPRSLTAMQGLQLSLETMSKVIVGAFNGANSKVYLSLPDHVFQAMAIEMKNNLMLNGKEPSDLDHFDANLPGMSFRILRMKQEKDSADNKEASNVVSESTPPAEPKNEEDFSQ